MPSDNGNKTLTELFLDDDVVTSEKTMRPPTIGEVLLDSEDEVDPRGGED